MVAFEGSGRCEQVEAYYYEYLEDADSAALPGAARAHIRSCAHCQRRLAELREVVSGVGGEGERTARPADWLHIGELQRQFELMGEPVSCTRVRPFLASLVDPSIDIRIPTPVTVHLDHCAACAEDLESLRETGQMAERADSGVITVCTVREEGQAVPAGAERDLYRDYPLNVQVLSREGAKAGASRAMGGVRTALRGLASDRRFRPYAKIAVFALALIPLAIMFSLTSPSATGLTVGEIGRVTAGERYICVSRFNRDGVKRQEVWVGRQEEVYVWREGGMDTLYDLKRDRRITVEAGARPVAEMLGREERERIEAWAWDVLALRLDGVPRGAVLIDVDRESVAGSGGTDLYKVRSRSFNVSATIREWHIHVDPASHRMQRRQDYLVDRNSGELKREREYTYVIANAAAFQERVERMRSR